MAVTYIVTDEIARILREERRRLGRSQAATAKALGASQTTLQKIENQVMKESSFLKRYWEWLGLPIDRFDQLQGGSYPMPATVRQAALPASPNGNDAHAEPATWAEVDIVPLIKKFIVWNDFKRIIDARIIPLDQQIKPTQLGIALMRRDREEERLVMTREVAEDLASAIFRALRDDPAAPR